MPRLNPACDIRKLPLTTTEGFVLSRIDGFTSIPQIAAMTGLGDGLRPVLVRLVELGAILDSGIEIPKKEPPAAPPPPPAPSGPVVAPQASRTSSTASQKAVRAGDSSPTVAVTDSIAFALTERPLPPVDEAALREEVDLDEPTKRQILVLFARLEDDHYAVLSVPNAATKKEIKSAYYKLAPQFHPDKYFRKNLGSFKARMEAVFTRLTTAHDTLTAKDKRAEYDQYLSLRAETAHVDDALDNVPVAEGARETPVVEPPIVEPPPISFAPITEPPEAQRAPAFAKEEPTTKKGGDPTFAKEEMTTSKLVPVPAPRRPEEIQRRREQMAARLRSATSGERPLAERPLEFAPEPVTASRAKADPGLREILARRGADSQRKKAQRYIDLARAAAERGDAVSASNAYRIALDFLPNDAEISAELSRWSTQAASRLVETYRAQGEYELSNGRPADAVRSFGRARLGAPDDASVLERLGFAMLKAGGDLHEAVEHVRKAVTLAPKNAEYHATLAELYAAANLDGAARRSVDTAHALAPQNERIKALRKRLTVT